MSEKSLVVMVGRNNEENKGQGGVRAKEEQMEKVKRSFMQKFVIMKDNGKKYANVA